MHKVVIERPRHGRNRAESRPRPKSPFENSPRFESIKARHTRRKWFSDLLGPLKRWLQSQVGQPWNDVYSEACAVIKPDSPIRAHVKTHLLQFVERNTFMHEGSVCVLDTGYLGKPVPVSANCGYRSLFFVHPETGLLHPSPRLSKRAWRAHHPRPLATIRWIRSGVALQQIRGLWFECHFEVVPVDTRFRAYDHALERVVTRSELTRHDKQYRLCTLKRQLSRPELRHYGFRNSPVPLSTGAQSSIGHTCRLKTVLQLLVGLSNFIAACAAMFNRNPQPGGHMANPIHDSEDSNFEITSKRRKGFPSETRVKRGMRVVHGHKELFEKLGRNDLCPCGSGRSF